MYESVHDAENIPLYEAKSISDLISISLKIEPGDVVLIEVPESERNGQMSSNFYMMRAADKEGYALTIVEDSMPGMFYMKRNYL